MVFFDIFDWQILGFSRFDVGVALLEAFKSDRWVCVSYFSRKNIKF